MDMNGQDTRKRTDGVNKVHDGRKLWKTRKYAMNHLIKQCQV